MCWNQLEDWMTGRSGRGNARVVWGWCKNVYVTVVTIDMSEAGWWGWKFASMAASITIYHCNYARGIVLSLVSKLSQLKTILESKPDQRETFLIALLLLSEVEGWNRLLWTFERRNFEAEVKVQLRDCSPQDRHVAWPRFKMRIMTQRFGHFEVRSRGDNFWAEQKFSMRIGIEIEEIAGKNL